MIYNYRAVWCAMLEYMSVVKAGNLQFTQQCLNNSSKNINNLEICARPTVFNNLTLSHPLLYR